MLIFYFPIVVRSWKISEGLVTLQLPVRARIIVTDACYEICVLNYQQQKCDKIILNKTNKFSYKRQNSIIFSISTLIYFFHYTQYVTYNIKNT